MSINPIENNKCSTGGPPVVSTPRQSLTQSSKITDEPSVLHSGSITGEPPVLLSLRSFSSYHDFDATKRNLPHWHQDSTVYFVTFRLADSLPVSKLNQWIRERNHWMKEHPEPWAKDEWEEYSRIFPCRMEEWIDAGNGECLLGCPEISKIVTECLCHFDGKRYALDRFVVMPNHVHTILAPLGSHSLSKIMQTWKSFTSHEINKRLNRAGKLWQDESFDHIVRSAAQLDFYRKYIDENPNKAKLAESHFLLGSGIGLSL